MQRLMSFVLELLLLLVKLTHLRSSALTKVVVFGLCSFNCVLGLLLDRLDGANSFMLRCLDGCCSRGGKMHDLCWVGPNKKVLLQVGFNLRMHIVLHVLLKERGLEMWPSSRAVGLAFERRVWPIRTNVRRVRMDAVWHHMQPPWRSRRGQPRRGRQSTPVGGRWIENNLTH